MVVLAHDLCTPLAPTHATVADLERIGADQPLLGQVQDHLDKQVGRHDPAHQRGRRCLPAGDRCPPAAPVGSGSGAAPEVLGDPVRLAQALCNLLENASKYTQIGGEISVSAAVAEQTRSN